MIIIASKRKKSKSILEKYPDAIIADVTSQAKDGLVKLSPFYPHHDIPVPFSESWTASCVEAIWQGLKVFETADVDTNLFFNDTMKNIKRTVRKYGSPLREQNFWGILKHVSRYISPLTVGCWSIKLKISLSV